MPIPTWEKWFGPKLSVSRQSPRSELRVGIPARPQHLVDPPVLARLPGRARLRSAPHRLFRGTPAKSRGANTAAAAAPSIAAIR